jgi:uncharacterized protein involved in outer membrane biogenesis
MLRRLRWRRRYVAIAAAALLALLVAVFDATWFRPLIQHYVREHAGRSVDFERLQIGLSPAFEPTVAFYGLDVENAAWAAKRPLVRAGMLRFSVAWRSFIDDKIVVTSVRLVDANVDLERQADGLRNWRLSRPDDRGPGRIRVLSIDAERSELRTVHGGLGLDVTLRMSPLAAPQSLAAHPSLPLNRKLDIKGTRNGQPFSGDAAVSDVLTFADTGAPFALRGQAQAGNTRLQVEGTATDLQQFGALDVDLRVASTGLSDLAALLQLELPRGPANLSAATHLHKRADTWAMTGLQATLARSDLRGDLTFEDRRRQNAATARPFVRASLASGTIRSDDFAKLFGGGPPQRKVDAQKLFTLDAEMDLKVDTLLPPSGHAIHRLGTHLVLDDGRLRIKPFAAETLGGHVKGELAIDGQHQPAAVALDLTLDGLRAEQLGRTLVGGVNGRVTLRSQGETVEALTAASAGSVSLSLEKATIPKRLDARLGLDGLAVLGTLFTDADERVPVQCAVAVLDVRGGRGTVRQLAFETGRVAVAGSGAADLATESVDLLLTPVLKESAVLALQRSIHVSGKLRAPAVELVERVSQPSGGQRCANVRNPLTPVVAQPRRPRDTDVKTSRALSETRP